MINTSIDVQELRKRIAEKAKAEPRHRFWGLYTHVWKLNVLEAAYRLAKKNGGAPGSDAVTFKEIEANGVEHLLGELSRELREKTYCPLPSRLVNIPKDGGTRCDRRFRTPPSRQSKMPPGDVGSSRAAGRLGLHTGVGRRLAASACSRPVSGSLRSNERAPKATNGSPFCSRETPRSVTQLEN